ncbi:MAG TPA: hypothetical protein PLH19_02030 [Anaerolineae bacterium]|nr:hypothetical protein [Anaerolineae bacterium]HQH37301.1 hypothetical protein [Anaerolineae bacterium]
MTRRELRVQLVGTVEPQSEELLTAAELEDLQRRIAARRSDVH